MTTSGPDHASTSTAEGRRVRLRSGPATLTLDADRGGRMASLSVGAHELLTTVGPWPVFSGCFAMAPYAGRVREGRLHWNGEEVQLPIVMGGHAMHGLCYERPWQVVGAGTTHAELRCEFDRRWWPWRGWAESRFDLREDGLTTTLAIHTDEDEMPAWCGWHPWFARRLGGATAELDLRADGMLRRDTAGLPTGEVVPIGAGPFDDAFVGVRWPVTLRWPGILRLAVRSDAGLAVVYTEKERAVCVEPQTAPPDAAALGRAAVVRRGEPLRLTMSWDWATDAD